MNKILCFLFIACCSVLCANGQKVLTSKEMVAITPALAPNCDLPEYAQKTLSQKLIQIITQNGFGSTTGDLILTANALVTDKQTTGTVPVQYVVNVELSLYLVNIQEGVVLDETSVSLRGIDKDENRAMAQAMNQLKPKSPIIRNFMNQCRTKVIDYYSTRIPAFLAKATSLSDRGNYGEALAVLAAVPESMDEYAAVAEQMTKIYLKKADKDAAVLLQEAKAQIAAKDHIKALNALIAIDPNSSQFTEATKLIGELQKVIDIEEKEAMKVQLAEYEAEQKAQKKAQTDAVMLEKMRIEAAKKTGENYSQSTEHTQLINDLLSVWFINKFK